MGNRIYSIVNKGVMANEGSSGSIARSMHARTGRDTQMYSKSSNARMVATCVALSTGKSPGDLTHVLLISSKKHPDRWVLPKGGCELDEEPSQSALREAWEEAGIIADKAEFLVTIHDTRNAKGQHQVEAQSVPPRAEYLCFEILVKDLEHQFPEMKERKRKWMTYSEVKKALFRQEMIHALDMSRLIKL